jgi:hypothetical protein
MSRRDEKATYVYAVVESPAPPDLSAAPPGLPGAGAPRLLPLPPGLWVVVADAPLASYGSAALDAGLADIAWVSDRALAHEAMVERLAAAGTVVPMKLFTLFASDERALAEMAARGGALQEVLARIAGCAEWGVRILWHEARVRPEPPPRAADGGGSETGKGRGFLVRKKQVRDSVREQARAARAESDRLYAELAGLSREVRRRAPLDEETGARLLLDANFLLPVDATAAFESAVRRGADRLAGAAGELTLSGPWPAYNFVAGAEEGAEGVREQA